MQRFSEEMLWGVATSAFQIEGGFEHRGRSVWDDFCERPKVIADGTHGRSGCDHYSHWKSDCKLVSELGADAYRLSISWPRLMPNGLGRLNRAGVEFYDRIIDELLESNVQPWLTLFHWDYPSELFYRGGWLNRDSADWFAEYTGNVVQLYSDRVQHWITLNEPQCFLGLGHYLNVHAPGQRCSVNELLRCIHHTLLAHGKSVAMIRNESKLPPSIGWSPVGWVSYPLSESKACINAARKEMFTVDPSNPVWPLNNSLYSDPVILGKYPEDYELFGKACHTFPPEDLIEINQKLDFYGVNIYHGAPITGQTDQEGNLVERDPGHPLTLMGWTVDPEALYWGPKFLYERYKLPIYITENGIASMDWVSTDGKVKDYGRIDYIERHLLALRRVVADGVDIRGYFLWSLLDNFEWELGFSRRFGLVYVDYKTGQRITKSSYSWYKETIKSLGENLNTAPANLR